VLLFKEIQFWYWFEQEGVAVPAQYGHNLQANQAQNVPELEQITNTRVFIDPRVIAEIDRKKPIGVTRTGWVNLLLQKAIASEPEPLARD
jgi:hypothetical protein